MQNKREVKNESYLSFNLGRSGLSCSLAFNGNFAFCFQKLRFFQTKTLQPQLVRAEPQTGGSRPTAANKKDRH